MARTTNSRCASRVRPNRRRPFLFLLTKYHRFASQTCAVAVGHLERALNASRRVHQSAIRRLKFPCFRSEGPPNPVDVAQRMPRDGSWTLEMVQEFYRQDSYVTDVHLRTFVYGARKEGDHSKAIGEIAPNLKGIKLEALRRAAKRSPTCRLLWGPIKHLVTSQRPPQYILPKDLEVEMSECDISTAPTHYLAVHGPVPYGSRRERIITITPVHALTLALYCTRLPPIPPSKPKVTFLREQEIVPEPDDEGDPFVTAYFAVRLPVLRLSVPKPDVFPILLRYFHRRNDYQFRWNLLDVVLSVPFGKTDGELVKHTTQYLATSVPPPVLAAVLRRIMDVNKNMLALRVTDQVMWNALFLCRGIAEHARYMQMDPVLNVVTYPRVFLERPKCAAALQEQKGAPQYFFPTPEFWAASKRKRLVR